VLTDVQREWRIRAALWDADWRTGCSMDRALPPAMAAQARWRYWARAAARLRAAKTQRLPAIPCSAARKAFTRHCPPQGSVTPTTPHPQRWLSTAHRSTPLAQLPSLRRAHELLLCDLRDQAALEWQYGIDALDSERRTQSIGLAMRWSWYDIGVATASRQGVFADYSLLFPRPYAAAVHEGAALAQLPEDFIYASCAWRASTA